MNLFFFLSKLFFAKSHNSLEGASQLYIGVCWHHSGLFGLLNSEFVLKQFVITLPPSRYLIDFGLVTYQKWLFPSIFSRVKFMPGVWAHLSHAKNFSCGAYEPWRSLATSSVLHVVLSSMSFGGIVWDLYLKTFSLYGFWALLSVDKHMRGETLLKYKLNPRCFRWWWTTCGNAIMERDIKQDGI